jgi:hypothetical protein
MTGETHWRWSIYRIQFREAIEFQQFFLLAISFYILGKLGFSLVIFREVLEIALTMAMSLDVI